MTKATRINDSSKAFKRISAEKVIRALGGEEVSGKASLRDRPFMKLYSKEKKTPWVQTIRRETRLIEHICEHGVGHPAIGSVIWMELNGAQMVGVHGCDGCCHKEEWRMADAMIGLEIAIMLLAKETGMGSFGMGEVIRRTKVFLFRKVKGEPKVSDVVQAVRVFNEILYEKMRMKSVKEATK